jgi:hypothetical protein
VRDVPSSSWTSFSDLYRWVKRNQRSRSLEGIEVADMTVKKSRRRLKKEWDWLRKACPEVAYLRLCCMDYSKCRRGVAGHVLHSLQGPHFLPHVVLLLR